MPNTPQTAMVFAAGMGKRMRPLTDTKPKPMIEVGGKSMLARALDAVAASHIPHAVVNTHYKANIVHDYLAKRQTQQSAPRIDISHEKEQLLETGGGIVHARHLLGNDPIYTINSDIIWKDNTTPALKRLATMWSSKKMDALLLLQPLEKAVGYDGKGNFNLTKNNQLCTAEGEDLAYVYTGIQIINPTLLYTMKETSFSLNQLYKNAYQPDGKLHRIYGLVHDAEWFHVGTPESIAKVETLL